MERKQGAIGRTPELIWTLLELESEDRRLMISVHIDSHSGHQHDGHLSPPSQGPRSQDETLMDENLPFFCHECQSTSPPSMRRWKAEG